MRRKTKEHAYLHRYNGIHGRPRNEDSCCPCETKLQTAAKLVFPSLAGRPPLRVITRSKVFDATARKKARRIYI